MCGRYTLTLSAQELRDAFPEVTFHIEHTPRFNVAPMQMVPVIRREPEGSLRADLFKWGLIPAWSKDDTIAARLINARAETLAEKPSFRTALKSHRCLIPADGFYEWVLVAETGKKTPLYFTQKPKQPFTFAGLWETWLSPEGQEVNSTTIITTEPNALIGRFHNRMPVILPPAEAERWLAPGVKTPEDLRSLLKPFPAEGMDCYPVSPSVNSARYDTPDLVEPARSVF